MGELSVQAHLLPIVVFLTMVTVGIELKVAQFVELLKAPRVPVIGTLIHTFSFPLVTVGLILLLNALAIPVADITVLGMLLIAACPSGGFSNILAMIAKANLPLSVSLTAVSSVMSFLTVPLLISGFAFVMTDLDQSVQVPIGATIGQLVLLVLAPVLVGMAWFRWQPDLVARLTPRLQKTGQLVLYVTVALLILESWEVMVAGFQDAFLWSMLLCVANIALCLGLAKASGLQNEDAITVALEGSIRNLAVAFVIAANVLDRVDVAALPTVYFLAVCVFGVLFAKSWPKLLKPSS